MQKIATQVFIYASIAFGMIGLVMVMSGFGADQPDSPLTQTFARLLFADVFIILPAFALSVADKFLKGR